MNNTYARSGCDLLVSVVIPVHDAYYQYLPSCLTSLTKQTWSHWEACVVDDKPLGDDGSEIVAGFADCRIRYLAHDRNRGLAAARNTGIRATRGPLVVTVDADDEVAPTFVETLWRALHDNPTYNAAFSDFCLFGTRQGRLRLQSRDYRALVKENWMPGPGAMFRRSLWEKAGGYCEHPALRAGCEDWDFWLTTVRHGLSAVYVPEPLYRYRQHASSMLQSLQYVDHEVRHFLYARHRELIDSFGLRRHFLGEGYRRAARASILRGEWRRGVEMALRSASLAPGHFLSEGIRTAVRALPRIAGQQGSNQQLGSLPS
jgi:glycosyltransferase involved in cell wall biosynthesis